MGQNATPDGATILVTTGPKTMYLLPMVEFGTEL